MINIQTLVCILLLSFEGILAAKPILRFRADHTFTIVQFTDTHFGELAWNDVKTEKVMKNVLEAEKPDLIVFSGDIQCTSILPITKLVWTAFTKILLQANVPWLITLGNHDIEADYTGDKIVALDASYALSLSERGPSQLYGFTNYLVHVWPFDNGTAAPAFNVWLFDTGHQACIDVPGGACVHPNQVQWYRQMAEELQQQYGRIIPAFAFMHIPPPEFINVWNYRNVSGVRKEEVCCWSLNTGLLTAFKEMGDVKLIGVGHDHWNDYIGLYANDIALAYGRKTGYGYSGPAKEIQKGARVYVLTHNPQTNEVTYKTHIRNEDKTIDVQPIHTPAPIEANPNTCVGGDKLKRKMYAMHDDPI
eukprot:TRINITY_DN5352_c0_g1_i1.p1 TRINITY_DN5352_c0_g1~~TRINITY_DN5352_c0_g1_i1.p1  ORF type:complete len:362 (-),score=63.72 TRINITY_DN5352_c0_g1_i1:168-1253(-)